MPKGEDITTKIKVDISNLKKGITEANKNIKLANAEFKAASAGMDDWTKSSDGLNAKLKQLNSVLVEENKKLDNYKSQLQAVEKAEQENGKKADELKAKLQQLSSQGISKTSDEYKKYEKALTDVEKEQTANANMADKLKVTILNQQAAVNKTEKEIQSYEKTLQEVSKAEKMSAKNGKSVEENLKQIAQKSDEAQESLNGLSSKLAGGIKKGLATLGTAITGFVTGLVASSEMSQDFVEDMGKLETAFTTSGHSAETAKKSYQEMVGILGETDQSVEAVNHLAKLTKSEQELAEWTNIAAGVYATFGDSLPLEGLTEAANETAKVGQVTGPLADALNWAGLSEDAFNNSLSKCNTEQERASLITKTLSELYRNAGNTYQETNKDLISARQATSDLASANAEMGKIVTPIVTKIKEAFAEFLSEATPKIKEFAESVDWNKFGETVKNALSKLTDALLWIIENKDIVIAGISGIIAAFAAAKIATFITALINVIKTIKSAAAAQGIFNAVMAANPIGLIVTAIGLLVAGIVLLIQNWDTVKEAAISCWEGIKNAWASACEWFSTNIIEPIKNIFSGMWEAVTGFFYNAWEGIKAIWNTVAGWFNINVVEPIKTFFAPLVEWFTQLFTSIKDFITSVWEVIKVLAQGCVIAIQEIWKIVSEWFNTNVIEPVKKFFEDLWNRIKLAAQTAWEFIVSIWNVVAEWFNTNIIQPVTKIFTELWEGIKTSASNTWNGIKEIWTVVSDWFNTTIIKPVGEFFTGMWENLKIGASNAWEGIKIIFSNITNWFRDKFSEAWTAVKNVFSTGGKIFDGIKEGILNGLKSVINGIIRGINKVIKIPFDGINSALNTIRNIGIGDIKPFTGLPTISVPQIPQLEKGGVLKRGEVGLLEGNGAEAVVPLERNKHWIKAVANEMKDQIVRNNTSNINNVSNTTSNVNNFTQVINAPKQPSRLELYRQTKNLLNLVTVK